MSVFISTIVASVAVVVKGSSTKETVYCGSKQPSQKDFALIINHKTGEFTLERLTYKLNLKRYVTSAILITHQNPAKVDSILVSCFANNEMYYYI